MKKLLLIILPLVLIVGGAVVFVLTRSDSDDTTNSTSDSTQTVQQEETHSDGQPRNEQAEKQTVGSTADCSSISLAQVGELWGVTMTDTDDGSVVSTSDGGKQWTCSYNETDSGMGLTVSIETRAFNSDEKAKSDIQNTRDGAKFGDTVYFVQDEVSGLGDEAFFSVPKNQVDNPKNPNMQMYLRKGSTVYLVSAVNLDGVKETYKENIKKTVSDLVL